MSKFKLLSCAFSMVLSGSVFSSLYIPDGNFHEALRTWQNYTSNGKMGRYEPVLEAARNSLFLQEFCSTWHTKDIADREDCAQLLALVACWPNLCLENQDSEEHSRDELLDYYLEMLREYVQNACWISEEESWEHLWHVVDGIGENGYLREILHQSPSDFADAIVNSIHQYP